MATSPLSPHHSSGKSALRHSRILTRRVGRRFAIAAHLCTSTASSTGARSAFSRGFSLKRHSARATPRSISAAVQEGGHEPLAKRACGQAGWTSRPAWSRGPARSRRTSCLTLPQPRPCPWSPASVQVAASITVIHHLEPHDQEAAVAELARVVRPGGERPRHRPSRYNS